MEQKEREREREREKKNVCVCVCVWGRGGKRGVQDVEKRCYGDIINNMVTRLSESLLKWLTHVILFCESFLSFLLRTLSHTCYLFFPFISFFLSLFLRSFPHAFFPFFLVLFSFLPSFCRLSFRYSFLSSSLHSSVYSVYVSVMSVTSRQ